MAQLQCLVDGADRKPSYAFAAKRMGNRNGAVTVSIPFDHSDEFLDLHAVCRTPNGAIVTD